MGVAEVGLTPPVRACKAVGCAARHPAASPVKRGRDSRRIVSPAPCPLALPLPGQVTRNLMNSAGSPSPGRPLALARGHRVAGRAAWGQSSII